MFALSQPLSDRAAGLVDRWRARQENVLLWASDESIFGVFLEAENDTGSLVTGLDIDPSSRDYYVLRVPCHRDAVPVYFDYEAGWVRATGLPGVIGYPRSILRDSNFSNRGGASQPTPAQCQAVANLASTVPARPSQANPPSFGSRLTRRGAEEKYIRRGWALFRSFLNPIEVARSVTGFPNWCAFVRGTLLPKVHVQDFFQALVAEAVVSPFLFATDEQTVLFATLSEGPGNRRNLQRVPVLPVVRRYLRDIAVVRWPLGSTRVIVDHAYGPDLHSRASVQLGGKS
ncbi:MAG: hypothetical protein WA688_07385 [Thermoplasmata archaeon]